VKVKRGVIGDRLVIGVRVQILAFVLRAHAPMDMLDKYFDAELRHF